MSLEGKTLLQRYRVLERKSRDANTSTYLVHDQRTGSLAMMKILSPRAAIDQETKARFERESDLLKRLSSPHMVGYLDHGEVDKSPYLLTQYVSGRIVGDYIDVAGKLPPNIALGITQQAATGIGILHENNILYRALSPHDIVIMPKGTIVLVESETINAIGGADITRPGFGLSMGSLSHMSPEVIKGDAEKRSDIYSLGATLFHMLTGRPPFVSKNLGELSLLIMKQEAPKLSSVADIALPEVEGFLSTCLAKDPAERFSSVEKFQEAINALRSVIPASEEEIRDSMVGLPVESVHGCLLHEPTGTRFDLQKKIFTIGRHKDRDINLGPFDHRQVVHRRHARVEKRASGWVVIPEPGARNGVWVNDRRVKDQEASSLHNGDTIHFAGVALRYISQE